MEDEKKYLTMKEAAEILNVSGETLRRWGKDGRISPERLENGRVRYLVGDVLSLSNASTRFMTQRLPVPSADDNRQRGVVLASKADEVATGRVTFEPARITAVLGRRDDSGGIRFTVALGNWVISGGDLRSMREVQPVGVLRNVWKRPLSEEWETYSPMPEYLIVRDEDMGCDVIQLREDTTNEQV